MNINLCPFCGRSHHECNDHLIIPIPVKRRRRDAPNWAKLLNSKCELPNEQFVDWLLSKEGLSIPYNPWLKSLTHAKGLERAKEIVRRIGYDSSHEQSHHQT